MSIASNKYAAKVFSEHPIAIWPLDDDAHYISLISEEERDISSWNFQNCSVNTSPSLPDTASPFQGNDTEYYGIIGDHTVLAASGGTIEIKSNAMFNFNSLNENLKNFSINFYIYQESVYVSSYEFGYKYFDTSLGSDVEVLTQIEASPISEWIRFNNTFDIDEFDSDTCEIIFRANVIAGGSSNEYNFIINAMSIGQWSEPYSSITLGSIPSEIPSSTGYPSLEGVSCEQYGPLSDNGFYVIEDGKLLAKTDGVPMTFGSKNCVKLYPSSDGRPSMIFPSKGFLSEEGRYSTKSLEFWLRIKPNTKHDRRIFGPINSNYGLYVSEGFITLAIGNNFQTHNVYEWYRPMLVHILYNEESCQLYINGEQVAEIEIDRQQLVFNSENDWLAFFSYDDIEIFEIDCISIMPYAIPIQVALRRFVWGQGVGSQEVIDNSFKGESTAIGFSNSDYSVNVIYPDKERWDAGYSNNLVTSSVSLKVPEYTLPDIFLSGRNIDVWYESNKIVNSIEYPLENHPHFITFRPGLNNEETEWQRQSPQWNEKSYLQFSTANIGSLPISCIFGVFELEDDISITRPLIHIVNGLNGKRLEININSFTIQYVFDGQELFSVDASGQEHLVVGFHIPTFSEAFGSEILNFFSSYDSLQIYVGGAPDTLSNQYETFEGKIYRISFSDASNYQEISEHFTENGIANYDDDSLFLQHYSTYTVSPFLKYGKFYLDISIASTWEEYYPLSMFSDYALDSQGDLYYGLDYLQFNIGYPSYIELIDDVVNTSNSSVNIFATFQLISEGADEPLSSFINTKEITSSRTVDASLENTVLDPYKAYKTKFSIIDGTIIYPPKNIKTEDVAMTLHFSINKDSILSHPLSIRDMKISSKTLNHNIPNPVGTKFGKYIYPYIKRGIYFDYKSKNPFLIYDKNDPYLNLTEKSGIKLLTFNEVDNEKMASIAINETLKNNFDVASIQLFMKYDIDQQINNQFTIFEIQHKDSTIEFFTEYDSSNLRIKVSARDKFSKEIYSNAIFYQNGIEVQDIYIEKKYWYAIGVIFTDPLDFSDFTGSINIFGGTNFDNISYYSSQGLNQISSIIPKSWQDILTEDNVTNFNWGYWYNNNGTGPIRKWKDLYIFSEARTFSLNASDIYNSYLGTNASIVDDGNGISILNDDFYVYSDILWSSTIGKPA